MEPVGEYEQGKRRLGVGAIERGISMIMTKEEWAQHLEEAKRLKTENEHLTGEIRRLLGELERNEAEVQRIRETVKEVQLRMRQHSLSALAREQ